MDLFAAVFQAVAPESPSVLADIAPPADPVDTRRAGYEFGRRRGWTADRNPKHHALELAIGQKNPEWCACHEEGVRAFWNGYYDALAEHHPHCCPGLVEARKQPRRT